MNNFVQKHSDPVIITRCPGNCNAQLRSMCPFILILIRVITRSCSMHVELDDDRLSMTTRAFWAAAAKTRVCHHPSQTRCLEYRIISCRWYRSPDPASPWSHLPFTRSRSSPSRSSHSRINLPYMRPIAFLWLFSSGLLVAMLSLSRCVLLDLHDSETRSLQPKSSGLGKQPRRRPRSSRHSA